MQPPRPGSRKAEVYNIWCRDGANAAIDAGSTLDLKEGTIRSWVAYWEKQSGNKATNDSPSRSRQATNREGSHRTLQKVRYIGELWTLLQEGPQQSELRDPSGLTRYIPNTWFTKVETP